MAKFKKGDKVVCRDLKGFDQLASLPIINSPYTVRDVGNYTWADVKFDRDSITIEEGYRGWWPSDLFELYEEPKLSIATLDDNTHYYTENNNGYSWITKGKKHACFYHNGKLLKFDPTWEPNLSAVWNNLRKAFPEEIERYKKDSEGEKKLKYEDIEDGEIFFMSNGKYKYIIKKGEQGTISDTNSWLKIDTAHFSWEVYEYRMATTEEINWYNACKAANKFISLEEANKSECSPELPSPLKEYRKCISNLIGFTNGKIYEFYRYSCRHESRVIDEDGQSRSPIIRNFEVSTKEEYDKQSSMKKYPVFKKGEVVECLQTNTIGNTDTVFSRGETAVVDEDNDKDTDIGVYLIKNGYRGIFWKDNIKKVEKDRIEVFPGMFVGDIVVSLETLTAARNKGDMLEILDGLSAGDCRLWYKHPKYGESNSTNPTTWRLATTEEKIWYNKGKRNISEIPVTSENKEYDVKSIFNYEDIVVVTRDRYNNNDFGNNTSHIAGDIIRIGGKPPQPASKYNCRWVFGEGETNGIVEALLRKATKEEEEAYRQGIRNIKDIIKSPNYEDVYQAKYVKCISLVENKFNNWSSNFKIGHIYKARGKSDLQSIVVYGNKEFFSFFCDVECFTPATKEEWKKQKEEITISGGENPIIKAEEKWAIGGYVRLLRDYGQHKKGDVLQIETHNNNLCIICTVERYKKTDKNGCNLTKDKECEWIGMEKPFDEEVNEIAKYFNHPLITEKEINDYGVYIAGIDPYKKEDGIYFTGTAGSHAIYILEKEPSLLDIEEDVILLTPEKQSNSLIKL